MKHKHKSGQKCYACEHSMEELHKKEAECLKKDKFYVHLVAEEDGRRINAHTHGLVENFSHPDLQIVAAIPPKIIMRIFWDIVGQLKEGKTFQDGKKYKGVIGNNLEVLFWKTRETGRDVLRIILPDSNGNLANGFISGGFEHQYDDLVDLNAN